MVTKLAIVSALNAHIRYSSIGNTLTDRSSRLVLTEMGDGSIEIQTN
jgi:hypothetical protein